MDICLASEHPGKRLREVATPGYRPYPGDKLGTSRYKDYGTITLDSCLQALQLMEIIPAIDIRNGKCVRLYQGDYSRETIFSEDPVAMALRWQGAGAKRLHLVDLDGAAAGELRNAPVIEEIAHRVKIPVQVGGGIRQIETINHLLDSGISRAILGTAAIEDPGLVEEACRRFGERIIVSIDAREGFVRGHGWKEGGRLTVNEVIHEMVQRGVKRFIYTDIARDGTLSGPDFEEIAKVIDRAQVPVIAAGGIASVEHLKRLAGLGAEGAIIGRAIYTDDIDLEEALTLMDQQSTERNETIA